MGEHNQLPAAQGGARRAALLTRMRNLSDAEPLQVDVHLDGEVVVPRAVAWEAESAAAALVRVSPEPYGNAPWRAYRQRFLDRYGPGVLVPLTDLADPATGLGLPNGFLGGAPAARPVVSRRDRQLLRLARRALAEDRDLELDDTTIEALAVGDPARMEIPRHIEVLIEVHSTSQPALDTGDFQAVVRGGCPGGSATSPAGASRTCSPPRPRPASLRHWPTARPTPRAPCRSSSLSPRCAPRRRA
ncbi:hypothetical protein GCM10020000_86020 [Streptomyces olivoverticillatus]